MHWYSREKKQAEDERLAEIKRIKELEADALAVALFVPRSTHKSSIAHGFVSFVGASNQPRNLLPAQLRLRRRLL